MDMFSALAWIYLYGFVIHCFAFWVLEWKMPPNSTRSPWDILHALFWFIWTPVCLIIKLDAQPH